MQWFNDLISYWFTHCQACTKLWIPHLYYSQRKNLVENVDDLNACDNFVSYNMKDTSHMIQLSHTSVIAQVKPQS